ncbi:MAG: hypothetical protein WD059_13275 [Balneolaceae bacterium]
MKAIYLFLIALFLIPPVYVSGQNENKSATQILNLLSERDAFLSWQIEWKQHHPNIELTKFLLHQELELELKRLQKIDSLSLHPFMIISPNGSKAINPWADVGIIKTDTGYLPGFDTSNHIRVFDYSTNISFQALFTGNYGPWIRGVAWLDDNLFVAVGEVNDLTGPNDKITPAVLIFDLNDQSIRIFIYEYILASNYHKKRNSPALHLTEPFLFLDF